MDSSDPPSEKNPNVLNATNVTKNAKPVPKNQTENVSVPTLTVTSMENALTLIIKPKSTLLNAHKENTSKLTTTKKNAPNVSLYVREIPTLIKKPENVNHVQN